MKLMDTIAAVSTPRGKGGVAMIRISGVDAVEVGKRVFRPASGKCLSELEAGKTVYGEICNPNGCVVDDGMATVFRAPHSFTGEDTVELTCHGGVLITEQVLRAVLLGGVRPAEAGEFTRRAYLWGKLKLTQAEALGNLLEAATEGQLTLARSGMKGHLARKTEVLYDTLRTVLTSVLAVIDFPDEDLSEMSHEELCEAVEGVLHELRRLLKTYDTGRAVSEGIPTVLCGKTNAGKSSVYNRILGYDAAIVTEVEGTTRDVLRESAVLGKTLLRLCDTAGLRSSEDPVESIGMERTREEMHRAGLILAVFDGSTALTEEDRTLCAQVKALEVPAVALWNKCDRGGPVPSELTSWFAHILTVSAKDGTGFDALGRVIDELFIDGTLDMNADAILTGARQFAALASAEEALASAYADLKSGVSLDLCCVGIEAALMSLGQLDGRELGEELVDEIFHKFCVGK